MAAIITRNETVDPKALSPEAFRALVDSLYSVHIEIFDGVHRDEFERYVVGSSADQTRIQVSYGNDGQIAGYLAVHAFRRKFRGEMCTIMRAEAGLRRAYRGNGSHASFFVSNLLKTSFGFGGPLYYLGCLVHPSSYSAFVRGAAKIWPSRDTEIPADTLEFMLALGDEFGLKMVDPDRPLIRHVGWITKDTEVERRYWQSTHLPAPRFYVEQNPGYVKGHGMLTLVPFDAASLGKSIVNWGATELKKSFRRTVGSLERTVVRPRLDERSAEDLLLQIENFVGFDLDSLRDLGLLGSRYPAPARTVLFRRGDTADAMYIILEGSVFVLDVDTAGEEVVIDQLGPGQTVGEMGLVTGQPRNATVRTATDSLLLRLTTKEFEQAIAAEPRLAEILWERVCWRTFATYLRFVEAAKELSHQARYDWYLKGTVRYLKADKRIKMKESNVLVLSMGELVIEDSRGFMALTAPAVVSVSKGARIRAIKACRLALVPSDPTASAGD